MDVYKCLITFPNLVNVCIFKRDWILKKFLVKFNHSSVYFCYLKNCAGFFGKPYTGCLCACCRIAISLVVCVRESDSLISIVSSFKSRVSCTFSSYFFQ